MYDPMEQFIKNQFPTSENSGFRNFSPKFSIHFGFSRRQIHKLRASDSPPLTRRFCALGRNLVKKLMTIFSMVLLVSFTGTAVGDVAIKEVPLRWEMVAKLPGDEVFNNLCAVCHGTAGKGDGPAASTLGKAVPDLTVLARNEDGVFPRKQVENVIFGRFRDESGGKSKMPYWGEHFRFLKTGVSGIPRNEYAWERTHTLATYVESLQLE